VSLFIGREDIVVRQDDDLCRVKDLGVVAELALKDADGAGAADIVRQQDAGIDLDVVAGGNQRGARFAGQDFFGNGHSVIRVFG